MNNPKNSNILISSDVARAIRSSQPVVALESTVITHGLPHPQNLSLARDMERIVRENGALPATVALIDGHVRVGLQDSDIERLAGVAGLRKVSRRDFATAILKKESGGTTVAGTMFAAHRAGIKVLATGGIGGVHEVESFDISADLHALSDTPMVIICAGAKAILDLPATLEVLETMSVPVVGYQVDEFPAFYSRASGLPVSIRLDSPEEIVRFTRIHWEQGFTSAVLVCQPLSPGEEIPQAKISLLIEQARREAHAQGIRGQPLTPFLLARLAKISGGASLRANLALLHNNARLAARVAYTFAAFEEQKHI